ncbi:M23 family metallopeptidase [Phenylobacterium sp.]|uniref:M23 family metallopeptidase n=1 Tax=Phenylobacterium sp. TaxID=1871053 RepID=UPI0025F6A900|nr:M23 family metallopeptidase [Phenylobacterium sp.]
MTVAALSAFAVAHASLLLPSKVTHPRAPAAALARAALRPSAGTAQEDAFLISFVEPVPGHAVVSPFGLRQLPWEENGRLHEGVDISADAGVPVRVAADGVVVAAGEGGGYGRYVAVRHAVGLTTFYAHLGSVAAGVKPGLAVTAGQAVGQVGSTGSSTGPHLHFEIRDAADHPLNPAMFLGKAFAEKGDLPLDLAKRYSGRVRIAYVSNIPASKQALMDAKAGKSIVVRRRETNDAEDLAAAEKNLEGQARAAAKSEKIDGLKGLSIGPDGRPRAQLSL